MVGTYVDLADVQIPFLYNQERWLRKRIWPCKVVEEKAGLIRLSGRGEPYWRFINNKMEWSSNGGPWTEIFYTPEQVDSCYQRYNPDLYTDIVIKPPTYAEINSSVLRGIQIRQDNYVVTIQMPSAEAARSLINFLESIK